MSDTQITESADPRPDYEIAKEQLAARMAELGIVITAVFVPWSRSRYYDPKAPADRWQLNWKITCAIKGRSVLETDYSAGSGHCPCRKLPILKPWRHRLSMDQADAIAFECEQGKTWRGRFHSLGGKAILPDFVSVFSSLLSDASVIDYAKYEDWGAELGYDPDSRKGEQIYRECLASALALRSALGDQVLGELQEIGGRL